MNEATTDQNQTDEDILTDTANGLDQAILTDEVSDEDLEAAADAERRNPTGRYSVMGCC